MVRGRQQKHLVKVREFLFAMISPAQSNRRIVVTVTKPLVMDVLSGCSLAELWQMPLGNVASIAQLVSGYDQHSI